MKWVWNMISQDARVYGITYTIWKLKRYHNKEIKDLKYESLRVRIYGITYTIWKLKHYHNMIMKKL